MHALRKQACIWSFGSWVLTHLFVWRNNTSGFYLDCRIRWKSLVEQSISWRSVGVSGSASEPTSARSWWRPSSTAWWQNTGAVSPLYTVTYGHCFTIRTMKVKSAFSNLEFRHLRWKTVKGGNIMRTPGLSFPDGFHIQLFPKNWHHMSVSSIWLFAAKSQEITM